MAHDRTQLTHDRIRRADLRRFRMVALSTVLLLAIVATLGTSSQPRAAKGASHVGSTALDLIAAVGQVKAGGIGKQTLRVPLEMISGGSATSTAIDVAVGVLILDEEGQIAKKLFKSMSVELRRNGSTVAKRSAKLTKKNGGATIQFDGLEAASADEIDAVVTFKGGAVSDAFVVVNAATRLATS